VLYCATNGQSYKIPLIKFPGELEHKILFPIFNFLFKAEAKNEDFAAVN
jgi:hypothetical protein